MRLSYKGFVIEATAEFSLGRFWPRAQIMKVVDQTGVQKTIMDKNDIDCCTDEKRAVNCAIEWATAWIDESS